MLCPYLSSSPPSRLTIFRSEKTVPKTSFASSSLERPLRAGLLPLPLPFSEGLHPLVAILLDCGCEDEGGLPFVLSTFEDEIFCVLWYQRLL